MISHKQKNMELYEYLLSGKLSIVLEEEISNKRNDILNYFQSIKPSSYYALLGRENNMIPFLTVEDNLLLGLSRKDKKIFLTKLKDILSVFKMNKSLLKKAANEITSSDQTIFQIIRALILNQTIIIFDSVLKHHDTTVFLSRLLPILKKFSNNNETTVVIVTDNNELALSNYYDQCILLEQLYK